jgi:hypothetical protein
MMLLVLVIIESSPLLALGVQNIGRNMFNGSFQYGCLNLVARTVSNDSMVRWMLYTCPSGPALQLTPSWFECGTHDDPCTRMIPTFTPPTGLLGLFMVAHGGTDCPGPYVTLGYAIGGDPE